MTRYQNLSGRSGVVEYEILDDSIDVKFGDGSIYTYTNVSADPSHIKRMKDLATEGIGLNGFIDRYVKKNYSDKKRI